MLTSYDLFGTKITPTTQDDLLGLVQQHVDSAQQCVIASQNMHGLYVGRQYPEFERLHSLADTYVHIDGMPIVWLCRLRGIGAVPAHRVTLIDWIWPLMAKADREHWRVYYLGGSEETLADGLAVLRDRFPLLDIAGHNGFFDEAGEAAIVDDIRAFAPQLILVGMGMGRQERWILKHLRDLGPATICTVGACMEYIAGTVRTPPRWMGRVGLEWLFRLAENPSRFWYRYTVEPMFVMSAVVDWLVSDSFSRESIYRSNAFARLTSPGDAGLSSALADAVGARMEAFSTPTASAV